MNRASLTLLSWPVPEVSGATDTAPVYAGDCVGINKCLVNITLIHRLATTRVPKQYHLILPVL